jgi:hypothetical protein
MAEIIPFVPGIPHQSIEVTLAGTPMVVEARWNAVDAAYYLDFYDADNNPIARSLKVVLGANLVNRSTHELLRGRAVFAVNYSDTYAECGIDDLGARIQVVFFTEMDMDLARADTPNAPRGS